MSSHHRWAVCVVASAFLSLAAIPALAQTPAGSSAAASSSGGEPLRQVITFNGVEREYFVRRPNDFNPNRTYWLVLAAHGAGGNGRTFSLANGIHRYGDEQGFSVIVAAPTFSAVDGVAQQFPSLGGGAFLDAVRTRDPEASGDSPAGDDGPGDDTTSCWTPRCPRQRLTEPAPRSKGC